MIFVQASLWADPSTAHLESLASQAIRHADRNASLRSPGNPNDLTFMAARLSWFVQTHFVPFWTDSQLSPSRRRIAGLPAIPISDIHQSPPEAKRRA
jgi:hypothetical protein